MEQAIQILQHYWGYEDFRPEQKKIVAHLIKGDSAFALLPTGGGKSICFQVPALCKEGICVVVSPLVALMRDQVTQLRKRKIQADFIYSGMSGKQIDTLLDNCIYGNVKFLYISPERLQGVLMMSRLEKMNINLIAIDEAHCVSQWGHDFRPSYQKINTLIQMHPKVPVVALTGTATKKVVQDILESLGKGKMTFFRSSFQRSNIQYAVYRSENKINAFIPLLKKMDGSGIVYLRSRKKVEQYSKLLNKEGISADYYHAGLPFEERKKVEQEWMQNQIKVVISTNAFGMGIDKSDVRFVVHCDIPSSLEEYYQESGRAGRDGLAARAIILYNQEDVEFQELMLDYTYPSIKEIKEIYHAIGNYYKVASGGNKGKGFPFDVYKFSAHFKLEARKVFSAIKILEKEGYFYLTDNELASSSIKIVCNQQVLQNTVNQQDTKALVLNHILRSYTGLFNDFVNIHEGKLADELKLTELAVKNTLQILSNQYILNYRMKSFLPILIYTQEKIPVTHLIISEQNLTQRKTIAKKQLDAMLNFVGEAVKCRTNIALFYFDEQPDSNCGHCDNCLQHQSPQQKKIASIVQALQSEELVLKDILLKVPGDPKEIIQAIRQLLDEGKLLRKGDYITLK